MCMAIQRKLVLIFLVIFFITSQVGFAGALDKKDDYISSLTKSKEYHHEKTAIDSVDYLYLPYLQAGGTRFFNVGNSNKALGLDFFIPLWQTPANLVFTDIRYYDRTGKPFEGNIHLGYRHLSPDNQNLYGVYGAFDRKRTESGNYFSQLTFGVECWLERLFIGGNFYQPIGGTTKFIGANETTAKPDKVAKTALLISNRQYEKALRGVDAEIGYEIINGLTGYAGGYYFKDKETNTIYGPKARLVYDWSLDNGKRILGIFDKVGLEVGVQKDKPRGTTGYLSANLRIGLMPNKNGGLQGAARHMVDLVRRDVDVVSTKYERKDQVKKKAYKNASGQYVVMSPYTGEEVPVLVDLSRGSSNNSSSGNGSGDKVPQPEKDKECDCKNNPKDKCCIGKNTGGNQEDKEETKDEKKERKDPPSPPGGSSGGASGNLTNTTTPMKVVPTSTGADTKRPVITLEMAEEAFQESKLNEGLADVVANLLLGVPLPIH